MTNQALDTADYWQTCYESNNIGWDMGQVSPPIKAYIDHLMTNHYPKNRQILIAGAGNAYEAGYLFENGFTNVYVVDFAEKPLKNFAERYPNFPKEQLICQDFFQLEKQFSGKIDLAIEQTFFCALEPQKRPNYVEQMHKLLTKNGQLVGLLFNKNFPVNPPFGGNVNEYRPLFAQYFTIEKLEPCYNSIPPRQGSELFMQMIKV